MSPEELEAVYLSVTKAGEPAPLVFTSEGAFVWRTDLEKYVRADMEEKLPVYAICACIGCPHEANCRCRCPQCKSEAGA